MSDIQRYIDLISPNSEILGDVRRYRVISKIFRDTWRYKDLISPIQRYETKLEISGLQGCSEILEDVRRCSEIFRDIGGCRRYSEILEDVEDIQTSYL